MNENLNPNYYAILTAEVRYDKNISDKAKLIYAELTALSNRYGFAWPSNSYLAELYNVSEVQISRILKQLEDNKYIVMYHAKTKKGTVRKIAVLSADPLNKNVKCALNKNVETHLTKMLSALSINNTRDNNTSIDSDREYINDVVSRQNEVKSKNPLSHFINIDLIISLVQKNELIFVDSELVFNDLIANNFKTETGKLITKRNLLSFLKKKNIRDITLDVITEVIDKYSLDNVKPDIVLNHLKLTDFKTGSGNLITTNNLIPYLKNWSLREWKKPDKESKKEDWMPDWVEEYRKELEALEDN